MSDLFKSLMTSTKTLATKIQDPVRRSQINDAFAVAEATMERFTREIDAIRSNPNLTVEGKYSARQEITEDTRAKLAELKRPLARLEERAAEIRASAGKKTAPDNEVLEFLRQKEIRDHYKSDPMVEQRYARAIESGENLEIAESLEASPVPPAFVTDDTRAKTAMHRLAAADPAAASTLSDIKLFSQVLNSTLDAASTSINQQTT